MVEAVAAINIGEIVGTILTESITNVSIKYLINYKRAEVSDGSS